MHAYLRIRTATQSVFRAAPGASLAGLKVHGWWIFLRGVARRPPRMEPMARTGGAAMCAAAALETLHVVIVHLSSNVSLKSPSSLQAHAAGTRVDRGGHVMREVGCMARAAHSPLPVRHATPGATICRHFLQGRCAFGSRLTAVKLVDNSKSDGPRPCESSGRSCSKVTHAATSTRCRSRCRRFRRLQWRTATAVARTWDMGRQRRLEWNGPARGARAARAARATQLLSFLS